MRRAPGWAVHTLAAAATLFAATLTHAATLTPEQERRAAHLYSELKCPVCKNQSLAASTSFLAEEMKAQIRDFVAAGKTDREIIEYYVERYGDWILLQPRARGFGWLAWLGPAVLLLFGMGIVATRLRRTPRDGIEVEPQIAVVSTQQRARIDRLVEGGP